MDWTNYTFHANWIDLLKINMYNCWWVDVFAMSNNSWKGIGGGGVCDEEKNNWWISFWLKLRLWLWSYEGDIWWHFNLGNIIRYTVGVHKSGHFFGVFLSLKILKGRKIDFVSANKG